MRITCTSFKPRSGFRTKAVHFCRSGCRCLLAGALAAGTPAADLVAGDGGRTQTEARGWLQLRQDQKTFRERVAPAGPAEKARLDLLERRQGLELSIEQERRRAADLREERSRRNRPGVDRPGRRDWGESPLQRQERQRQRIEMRIEREIFSSGPR